MNIPTNRYCSAVDLKVVLINFKADVTNDGERKLTGTRRRLGSLVKTLKRTITNVGYF